MLPQNVVKKYICLQFLCDFPNVKKKMLCYEFKFTPLRYCQYAINFLPQLPLP